MFDVFISLAFITKVCFGGLVSDSGFARGLVDFDPISIVFSACRGACGALHVGWGLFRGNEGEEEEEGDEGFRLLYYLSYVVRRGIGGFPNPCALRMCR